MALVGVALLSACGGTPRVSPTASVAQRPNAPTPVEREPQEPTPAPEQPSREVAASDDADALERAFLARMTVHRRRDGTPVLSRRCREGPVDCEARVAAFARMLTDAARATGLDPFLLGALAWRESGLNPAAVSRRGAAGILQLHPRGVGRGMRFVTDRAYRRACQSEIEACQGPIVTRGAEALAGAIERCGSLRSALGAYASGHCTERPAHIDRVLEEQETLRSLAEE